MAATSAGTAVFRAIADFSSVINQAGRAGSALGRLGDQAAGVGSRSLTSATLAGSAMRGLGKIITGTAKVGAGALVGMTGAGIALTTSIFKTGIAYNTLQQSSRAALKTLLGGTEAANAQMDKLDDFARTSPFAKDVFIQAQQQLIGFGFAADKVLPTLDAIQQAVAATGGSGEQIAGITAILAKVRSSMKFTAEDLNMLGGYGLDAATLIGDSMGKSGTEIREAISKGTIGAEEAIDALVSSMGTKFAGATDGLKEQFAGAKDSVKGAMRDIGSALATPFVDPHGGGMAVDWFRKVATMLRSLEAKVKPVVTVLQGRLQPAWDAVGAAIDWVNERINAFDVSRLDGQLNTIAAYAPLISAVVAAVALFGGSALLGPLGLAAPAISPLIGALVALVATSPGLRTAFSDFVTALSPLLPIVTDLAKVFAANLLTSIEVLAPSLGRLLQALVPVIFAFANPLLDGLSAVIDIMVPTATAFATVATAAAGLPTPILAAVTAMILFRGLNFARLLAPLPGLFTRASTAVSTFSAGTRIAAIRAGAFSLAFSGMGGAARNIGGALMGAFGGPVGLAIAGVAAAVGVFAANAQKAREQAAEFRGTLDAMGRTTLETTDMIKEAFATRGASNFNLFSDKISEIAADMGVSFETVKGAIMGVPGAVDELNAAGERYLGTASNWQKFTGERATNLTDLKRFVKEYGGSLETGIADQEAYNRAQEAAVEPIRVQSDAVQSNTDKIKANSDAKRDAAGAAISLKEGLLREAEAVDRVREAIRQRDEVLANPETTPEERAAAERGVEQSLLDQVTAFQNVRDAMVKNNATADEVAAKAEQQRADFITLATESGYAADAANALADELGLIPADIKVNVDLNDSVLIARADLMKQTIVGMGQNLDDWIINADGTRAESTVSNTKLWIDSQTGTMVISGDNAPAYMDIAAAEAKANAASGVVTISADTRLASDKVEQFNTLTATPGRGPIIDVDADAKNAEAKRQFFHDKATGAVTIMPLDANPALANGKVNGWSVLTRGTIGMMTLDANGNPALNKRAGLLGTINNTTGVMGIDGNPNAANRATDGAVRYATGSGGTITVDADTSKAKSKISSLSWFASIQSAVVKVSGAFNNANGGYSPDGAGTTAFAEGGFSGQRRVAQIAKPGANILWGESETRGESYIPHARSKRGRAMKILSTTAALFGAAVTPKTEMAEGGTTGLRRLPSLDRSRSIMGMRPPREMLAGGQKPPVMAPNMNTSTVIENVNVYNPVPERASTSLARQIRKTAQPEGKPQ